MTCQRCTICCLPQFKKGTICRECQSIRPDNQWGMIWSEINRMWKTYHQVSAWLASTSGLWVKHVKSENPLFCLPLKVPQTGFDGISSRQGNLIMVIKVINGHLQLLLRWVEFTNILVDPVADNSSEVDVINHPCSLVAGFMASHLKSIIFAQFASTHGLIKFWALTPILEGL